MISSSLTTVLSLCSPDSSHLSVKCRLLSSGPSPLPYFAPYPLLLPPTSAHQAFRSSRYLPLPVSQAHAISAGVFGVFMTPSPRALYLAEKNGIRAPPGLEIFLPPFSPTFGSPIFLDFGRLLSHLMIAEVHCLFTSLSYYILCWVIDKGPAQG